MRKGKFAGLLLCTLLCAISVAFTGITASAQAETPAYSQDFSEGMPADFVSESGNAANWTVSDGMLKSTSNAVSDFIVFGSPDWTEYAIDFACTTYSGQYEGGFQIYVPKTGEGESSENGEYLATYLVGIRSMGWAHSATGNLVELYGKNGKTLANSENYVNGVKAYFPDEHKMDITVVVRPRQLRVFINKTLYIDYSLQTTDPDIVGKVGLRSYQSVVGYGNIVVREIVPADLETPEPPPVIGGGGANSHLEITTRSGQGDTSNFLIGSGLLTGAMVASVAAMVLCVGFWVMFILGRKKARKGDKT